MNGEFMMLYISVFILVFALFISLCTGVVLMLYVLRQKNVFLQEALATFAPKIEAPFINFPDDSSEMEKQVDERLDEIILTFKRYIPMIGMFLSQKKEEDLRGLAKTELMKLIPALKQKYLQRVDIVSKHAQDRFSTSQFASKINQLCTNIWKQVQLKLFCVMIAIGLILGLLEIGLFYLLFH